MAIFFLTARFGKPYENGSYILCKFFTHKLIGDTVNLYRESVSREIAKLQEQKLIGRLDNQILVYDVTKLANELNWPISTNLWGLTNKLSSSARDDAFYYQ